MKRHIFGVIRTIIVIGMSIQLGIGIFWLLTNFFGVQEFGDSYLFQGAWYCLLYLIQLGVGFFASYTLTATVCDMLDITVSKWWKNWAALCIMSVPMIMQCYLAVLPNSLTASCYLLMLSLCLKAWDKTKETDTFLLVKMGVLWLIVGLLMPEYVLFGGILFLVILLRKVHVFRQVFIVIIFAAMAVTLSGAIHTTENIPLKAVSRFVWPDLQRHYVSWPAEVHGVISWEEAGEMSQTTEHIFEEFAPKCEEALGQDKANEVYWQMTKTALDIRTREIAERILWDMAGYMVTPGVLLNQLDGQGYEAFSGRNYEIMKMQTPGITKIYVYYSCRWFIVALILSVVMKILNLSEEKRIGWSLKVFVISNLLIMGIYYTMQGTGMMDYKKALPVMAVWFVWMIKNVLAKERIGETHEG